ncbi:MAG: hypothetical protein H6744_15260 [Deltaproteobacteria bacterium]|nr:hypothetical protein [Deltaproteobacteria bacterium]MCB9788040.1 hypothetical protein [Deltaproteobacteria bacterium]
MVDRITEGVRVCVRCGREGGLRDVRCAECGFDLTSDLQRDYDRYRSSTSGRGGGPATAALDAAQPRRKTAPNLQGAIGKTTPAPGAAVLDAALDDARRTRAGRSAPAAQGQAGRTRGGGQRVPSPTSLRPPAPPRPASRPSSIHAPVAPRPEPDEGDEPESVANLLSDRAPDDDAAFGAEAGPRTSAWHPGAATEEAGAETEASDADDAASLDAPVTRAWGDLDLPAGARSGEAIDGGPTAAAESAASEPDESEPGDTEPDEEEPDEADTAEVLAQAAAEAVTAAAAASEWAAETVAHPEDEGTAGPHAEAPAGIDGGATADPEVDDAPTEETVAQPDEATVMIAAADVEAALGAAPEPDPIEQAAAPEPAGTPAVEALDPRIEAAESDATVMLDAVTAAAAAVEAEQPPAEERTVAMAYPVDEDDAEAPPDDEARTVVAPSPFHARAAAAEPVEDEPDDARTVVDARVQAPPAAAAPDTGRKPGSRRKSRRRTSGSERVAAAPAEPTVSVPVHEPAPAQRASPPTGGGAAASSTRAANDAAMVAAALAPSHAFAAGGTPRSGPISQNLRPGTTTYVDATRRGFRRPGTQERDLSGAYIAAGVVLGLAVLAALLYFVR